MFDWTRRAVAGAGLALAASPAPARTQVQNPAQSPAQAPAGTAPPNFAADRLHRGRLTVPVRINDSGPYTFAVDSAANASVVASDLAAALSLRPDGEIAMHTLIARELVGTVRAERLRTGALDIAAPRLALGSRLGMSGLDGLIGTDLLSGLRLELAFRGARRIRVSRSRRSGDRFLDAQRPSARLVRAVEQRFGELLMFEARIGAAAAFAILDTGAQVSIANTALARASGASPAVLRDGSTRSRVQSPTGLAGEASPMVIPNLRFGGMVIGRLPVLVGDFHTFDLWGLADTPALLMGVDVLGMFDSVAIDLKRGEVVFEV